MFGVSPGVTQGIQLVTGSTFGVTTFSSLDYRPNTRFITTIKNLKPAYSQSDKVRFRIFARHKDWQPNIYTVAKNTAEPTIVEDGYYRIFRVIDEFDVIPFGSGSGQQAKYTKLSYDKNGNYFDLDMSLFESDYQYAIQFVYNVDGRHVMQEKIHKFRVEK